MESLFSYEKKEEDDYYCILRCGEHSSDEQIQTEYKLLALQCHPDKNPNDPNAAKAFTKLKKAKEVLCDHKLREEYDKWRHSQIPMPFDCWMNMKDSMHTSMHWAMKTKSDPMIECHQQVEQSASKSESFSGSSNDFQWERTSDSMSEALRKFRNYEI